MGSVAHCTDYVFGLYADAPLYRRVPYLTFKSTLVEQFSWSKSDHTVTCVPYLGLIRESMDMEAGLLVPSVRPAA